MFGFKFALNFFVNLKKIVVLSTRHNSRQLNCKVKNATAKSETQNVKQNGLLNRNLRTKISLRFANRNDKSRWIACSFQLGHKVMLHAVLSVVPNMYQLTVKKRIGFDVPLLCVCSICGWTNFRRVRKSKRTDDYGLDEDDNNNNNNDKRTTRIRRVDNRLNITSNGRWLLFFGILIRKQVCALSICSCKHLRATTRKKSGQNGALSVSRVKRVVYTAMYRCMYWVQKWKRWVWPKYYCCIATIGRNEPISFRSHEFGKFTNFFPSRIASNETISCVCSIKFSFYFLKLPLVFLFYIHRLFFLSLSFSVASKYFQRFFCFWKVLSFQSMFSTYDRSHFKISIHSQLSNGDFCLH